MACMTARSALHAKAADETALQGAEIALVLLVPHLSRHGKEDMLARRSVEYCKIRVVYRNTRMYASRMSLTEGKALMSAAEHQSEMLRVSRPKRFRRWGADLGVQRLKLLDRQPSKLVHKELLKVLQDENCLPFLSSPCSTPDPVDVLIPAGRKTHLKKRFMLANVLPWWCFPSNMLVSLFYR